MKVITGKRGSGKTDKLINRSILTGFPIVCINQGIKRYILDAAYLMGCEIKEPVTYNEFICSYNVVGRSFKSVIIDDSHEFIEFMINQEYPGLTVDTISVATGDKEETASPKGRKLSY